jgi:hypothetical protein
MGEAPQGHTREGPAKFPGVRFGGGGAFVRFVFANGTASEWCPQPGAVASQRTRYSLRAIASTRVIRDRRGVGPQPFACRVIQRMP